MSSSASPAGSDSAAATTLTDQQVLAIVDAANDKEIEESKVVVDTAKNKDVKAFAKMMIDHHEEAKKKQAKLVDKTHLTVADALDAKKLQEETKSAIEKLKKQSGADLERAYIDLMVTDHRAALDLVTNKLLSAVKNGELKTLLADDLKPRSRSTSRRRRTSRRS